MGNKKRLVDVLIEHMDEEIYEKLPAWFKILRGAYEKRVKNKQCSK